MWRRAPRIAADNAEGLAKRFFVMAGQGAREQGSVHKYVTAVSKRRNDASAKLIKRGAIAQLGEHLLCKQEVGGSIPPGSTTEKVNRNW